MLSRPICLVLSPPLSRLPQFSCGLARLRRSGSRLSDAYCPTTVQRNALAQLRRYPPFDGPHQVSHLVANELRNDGVYSLVELATRQALDFPFHLPGVFVPRSSYT
jgi:hypothetical protein